MFANTGTFTASANCRYIAKSVIASGKIMSAPASTQACARSMAASKPSTASASVRAIITKFSSTRASTAALMRSTISSLETMALFGRCPQRFCATWSSIWTAATPARSKLRIVRAILNAPPQPTSMSTSKGVSTLSVIRRASISTSSIVVMPKSGIPHEQAATPPPDRYTALNPLCVASRAK